MNSFPDSARPTLRRPKDRGLPVKRANGCRILLELGGGHRGKAVRIASAPVREPMKITRVRAE